MSVPVEQTDAASSQGALYSGVNENKSGLETAENSMSTAEFDQNGDGTEGEEVVQDNYVNEMSGSILKSGIEGNQLQFVPAESAVDEDVEEVVQSLASEEGNDSLKMSTPNIDREQQMSPSVEVGEDGVLRNDSTETFGSGSWPDVVETVDRVKPHEVEADMVSSVECKTAEQTTEAKGQPVVSSKVTADLTQSREKMEEFMELDKDVTKATMDDDSKEAALEVNESEENIPKGDSTNSTETLDSTHLEEHASKISMETGFEMTDSKEVTMITADKSHTLETSVEEEGEDEKAKSEFNDEKEADRPIMYAIRSKVGRVGRPRGGRRGGGGGRRKELNVTAPSVMTSGDGTSGTPVQNPRPYNLRMRRQSAATDQANQIAVVASTVARGRRRVRGQRAATLGTRESAPVREKSAAGGRPRGKRGQRGGGRGRGRPSKADPYHFRQAAEEGGTMMTYSHVHPRREDSAADDCS